MKTLTLMFLITINYSIYAQESIFVRVYSLSGIKINSGHVFSVTDSTLQLTKDQSVFIPVKSIGYIKTKRSEGNNILIGSIVGATSGAILGAVTANSDPANILDYDKGTTAAIVGIIGMAGGAGIGGLTILLKRSKTYFINGDLAKWKSFQPSPWFVSHEPAFKTHLALRN